MLKGHLPGVIYPQVYFSIQSCQLIDGACLNAGVTINEVGNFNSGFKLAMHLGGSFNASAPMRVPSSGSPPKPQTSIPNPESRIPNLELRTKKPDFHTPNPESQVPNLESRILNLPIRILNPESKMQKPEF